MSNHEHHHSHCHSEHSHHHGHHHHHHGDLSKTSNIMVACLLNFGFSIIEIIGGLLFNSTAILSDAVHDLGDALVLFLSVIFEKQGKKESNKKYSYGYRRLALIGALINSFVLLFGTILILYTAVENFFNPKEVVASGMFLMSILGIAVNGFSLIKLFGSKNILDRSVFAHILEDVLGWVAVFVVSIVIYFTGWNQLDSILSIIIAVIILRNVWYNLKTSYDIIMQVTPNLKQNEKMEHEIVHIEDVEHIVDSHEWSLDGEHVVYTAKIKVNNLHNSHNIRQKIAEITNKYHIMNTTIEFVSE